jgi:predicted PurR-regulated permease PerM
MSLHNYLEKLRAKPIHERKRIAVIATAVGFLVILLIWVVSFNEMNKPAETQVDPASASLNDLKDNFQDNFQTGKDSIQNMMQELPGQAGADTTSGTGIPAVDNSAGNALPAPSADSIQNMDNSSVIDNPAENNNQNKDSVPQLP